MKNIKFDLTVLLFVCVVVILVIDNHKKTEAFKKYCFIHDMRYKKDFSVVSENTGVPLQILNTGYAIEQGSNYIDFGVHRLPEYVLKYPLDEWQARSAARIYTQVAFKYILSDKNRLKEFCEILTKRYCPENKKYAENFEVIYAKEKP